GEGHAVALVGPFRPALAGSELDKLRGRLADGLPEVDLEAQAAALETMRQMAHSGGLASAHDVSEGGLACALAECCAARGIGARVDLGALAARLGEGRGASEAALFGEGPGGVVVSGPPEAMDRLSADAGPGAVLTVGETGGGRLEIVAGAASVSVPVDDARAAREGALPGLLS
nr:AIR synthase-related protein [Actinomycetota bacterium]